ncbi:hypothetical protein E4U13_003740 [Claviceps humidiphila]|uniref:Translation initiation factor IF-2, mitochondrial n=1 Tax=Claviceps humidiphila TaxID=1294629 RepID=A0A9P7PZG7_9HYPO|nr:hypothetical protein E4U13_003740 [Claviceps humidiphila]
MLRARAWKGRGYPFICEYCRVQVPSTSSPGLLRTPNIFSFCTTSELRISDERSKAAAKPSAPGRLAGGRGSFGSLRGSFAPVNTPQTTTSSAQCILLPHELEARKKSPLVETKSAVVDTKNRDRRKTNADRRAGPARRGHEAQIDKSISVLTEVFKSITEPQTPSSANQTPTNVQNSASTSTSGAASTTNTTLLSKSSDEKAHSSRGQNTRPEPKALPAVSSKRAGWGAFSQRKAESLPPTQAQTVKSNGSRRPSDTSHLDKTQSFSQRKPMHQRSGRTVAETPSESRIITSTQDFWAELNSRVVGFKEGKGEGRREAPADDGDLIETKSAQMTKGKGGSSQSDNSALHHETWQNERRKSRFEIGKEMDSSERSFTKKSKKSSSGRRGHDAETEDEAIHRWEQKRHQKAEKEAERQRKLQEAQPALNIFLPEYISALNLAQALQQRPDQFLLDMEEMGFENVTTDTILTGETAALVSMEYGFEPTIDTGSQRDLRPRPAPEDVSSVPSRPPVVTIMGHVDHGKTTLLDYLRKSSVAAQEHGGITQHIGAFVVSMSAGKQITFLDTPGHAAFLSMRQRGAHVTDIVVLVVAADDSVKPQTIEAIKHATAAKVPIIVAINKIDKETARVEQVKSDLARHGVEIEDYGGEVQVVCVSGKTGQGMADLEESIITLAEILDVRAEYDGMAEGWILESSVKMHGRSATALVKRGTLRPGDIIVAGKTWARIRTMRNEAGTELAEAPPGTPIEILGWRDLPEAGKQVLQAPDETKAKMAVEYRIEMADRQESSTQLADLEQRQREKAAADAAEKLSSKDGEKSDQTSSESGIIVQNFTVKADVVGSVEAVCGSILEVGNHEVQPKILRSAAGHVTESDIDHAAVSNSVIVNFNLPIAPHVKRRAEDAKVTIIDHNVIYHVVDDIKETLSALLPVEITNRVTGDAEVLQVFSINVKKRISKNVAGCRVRNGTIKKFSLVRVIRKGKVVFQGTIDTLKQVKKDVLDVGKDSECGIEMEGFQDYQVEDQIQTYEEVTRKRTL